MRGRQIVSPTGRGVRPTSSILRQAVFNILGDRIYNADFLDLYAGTGIMSVEALSRGARFSLAVENSNNQVQALRRLIQQLQFSMLEVVSQPVEKWIENNSLQAFSIIYADPPFIHEYPDLRPLFAKCSTGCAIFLEFPTRAPPSWLQEKNLQLRSYGESSLAVHWAD